MSPGRGGVPGAPAAGPFAGLEVIGAPYELIALGGTLEPDTLIDAYRHGCFPWPTSGPQDSGLVRDARRLARRGAVPVLPGQDGLIPWCSPHPRAVLIPADLRVSRSLRRTLVRSGWQVSVDEAFAEVVAGCAARQTTWITDRMQQAYLALHRRGGAHSVEVWDGGRLVGGLYGVLTGRVFSGESMFFIETDASKVALVALVQRMREGGVLLLDTQQQTEHMTSLGQVVIARAEYVQLVHRLRDEPGHLPLGRQAAADLT